MFGLRDLCVGTVVFVGLLNLGFGFAVVLIVVACPACPHRTQMFVFA